MMFRLWLLLRLLVGWVFTLAMAALACVPMLVGKPVWGWKLCMKPWARGAMALMGIRLNIEGAEWLRGPALFIGNHQSLIDVVFVPAIVPTTVRMVAKKELRKVPFWGWILSAGGGIMIDRKNPESAIKSIRDGVRALPKGWSIAIFPEGTRSHDGRLKTFKKGAFHIAIESGLPVVPFAIEGAYDMVPKHAVLIRPGTIQITVGEPIDTSGWRTETIDQHVAEGFRAVAKCLARSRERHVAAMRQLGRVSSTANVAHQEQMPTGGNASGGFGHSNMNVQS